MNDQTWVRVAKIQGDLQAELLRGLLEAQEIPVLLSREGAGRAIGLTVGPLGEVEVMVPAKFRGEAVDLLGRYERGELDTGEAEET